MAIVEGKWKCPGCGEVNRGAASQCGSCGATRDASVKFFVDEDAPEVTDAAVVARAKGGADWLCAFCQNANPSFATVCTGCGAPATEGKQKKHGDVIPVPGQAPQAQPAAAAPAGGGKGLMACIPILLLLCVAFSGFYWWRHRDRPDTASVTALAWNRTISIEDFLPTQESQWESVPQGAYSATHKTEQKGTREVQRGTKTIYEDKKEQTGTKKVKTGKKDMGNGFFEDVYKDEPIFETRKVPREVPNMVTEPVYAEKYYYTIDKWRESRKDEAKGTTEPPAWPKVTLKGKEREGPKVEVYQVTFHTNESNLTKTLKTNSEASFATFKMGATWSVAYNNAGDFKVLKANNDVMTELTLEAEDKK